VKISSGRFFEYWAGLNSGSREKLPAQKAGGLDKISRIDGRAGANRIALHWWHAIGGVVATVCRRIPEGAAKTNVNQFSRPEPRN
jgi:hypothetical protein